MKVFLALCTTVAIFALFAVVSYLTAITNGWFFGVLGAIFIFGFIWTMVYDVMYGDDDDHAAW